MSGAVIPTVACEQKGRYSRCAGSLGIIEPLPATRTCAFSNARLTVLPGRLRLSCMHLGGRRLCAKAFVAGLTTLVTVSAIRGAGARWPQYGFNARHTLFNPAERTP